MLRNRNSYIGDTVSEEWTIKRFLSSGSFGSVYEVKGRDEMRGVVKIETSRDGSLRHEVEVLQRLQHLNGFPKLYSAGEFRGLQTAVMQCLGESLASIKDSHRFRTTDILKVGIQMVGRLRDLHSEGFVHRDIHDGNILTGNQSQGEGGKLYLIDFGETGQVDGDAPNDMYGNFLFAPNAALRMQTYSPKDDLESLVYVLVYLYQGSLPWSRFLTGRASDQEYVRRCLEMRRTLSSSEICEGLPGSILEMLSDVREITRVDTPDYDNYIQDMRASFRAGDSSENNRFSWE